MAQRDKLDRFYTPASTVEKCLSVLSIDDYDIIVEPSAGAGAFFHRLPSRTQAYDISPQADGIHKRDWLEVSREEISDSSKDNAQAGLSLVSTDIAAAARILVVGNPPFGVRSSLAKKFISHAIDIGADTVAFVLPDTFSKRTNQRCFPNDWRLVCIMPLSREECTFELHAETADANTNTETATAAEQNIFIPCSFFVWTVREDLCPDEDLRDRLVDQPSEYSFCARGDERADFALNGNNGKTKALNEITNPKAEHYIKAAAGINAETLRKIFDDIPFDFRSSVNGGVAWISQNDINKTFIEYTSARDDNE